MSKSEGTITRNLKKSSTSELSVIDYVLICKKMEENLVKIVIDEDINYVLTKYATKKGIQYKVETDHNALFGEFDIEYKSDKENTREDFFN